MSKSETPGKQSRGLSRLFNDRKIGTKIGIGFTLLLAITVASSVLSYLALQRINVTYDTTMHRSEIVNIAGTVDREFLSFRRYMLAFLVEHMESDHKAALARYDRTRGAVDLALTKLVVPERREKMKQISEQLDSFKKNYDKVVGLKNEQEKIVKTVLEPASQKMRASLEELQREAALTEASDVAGLAGDGVQFALVLNANVTKVLVRHDQGAAAVAEGIYSSLKQIVAGLDNATNGTSSRKTFNEIKSLVERYGAAYEAAVRTNDEIYTLTHEDMKKVSDFIDVTSREIKDGALSDTQKLQQETDNLIDWTENLIVTLAVLGLVLGSLFGWLISRATSRPVVALVGELKKLAEGDFNVEIPGLGRKDEVGEIAEAAEMVADRVGATIVNIKMSASEVTNASAEISTSTTDLSQRTEEQAASLEETSASMEEMTATVKKNAENARQASDLASSTREVADRGGAVVAKTVEAMAKIEESSRKISDIIIVIDEIARQTNLLALNAAVEAARAGDAGRGFAVVASEVRSLAQRSSQAAKDIKDLITSSTGQVKDGVELVNRAGQSLHEIVESIKKVTTVVTEIANASMEQSSGIEQINRALTQMDEVTQQNSALVEENAATAKTLEQQAKSMDERVAVFKVRADAQQAAQAQVAAAAPAEQAAPIAMPRPESAAPSRPVAQKRTNGAAHGGPAGRMQGGLAVALKEDDWKEF